MPWGKRTVYAFAPELKGWNGSGLNEFFLLGSRNLRVCSLPPFFLNFPRRVKNTQIKEKQEARCPRNKSIGGTLLCIGAALFLRVELYACRYCTDRALLL